MKKSLLVPATFLGLVAPGFAQLPYNPTRIISANNGSLAYIFSPRPSSSQFSLSLLDTSASIDATPKTKELFSSLPFLSSSTPKSFTPVVDEEGLDVLAGNCQDSAKGLELWRFTPDKNYKNGTWEALQLVLDDATLSSNFLATGTSFSPSASLDDSSVYVFGGMCPTGNDLTAANWVSQATYSNTMLTLSPQSASDATPYQLSMTGSRAPPIAEAGLTMTPLTPSFTNTSTGSVSQQQNFVLLGGHTENAFINMSQAAIFSLPQESWTFVGIDGPSQDSSRELFVRDNKTVEPRSGHTAVLSEDGSKIIVFGGWVGDINTPASPQLAVLEIGEGYGGVGNWKWTIPSRSVIIPYSPSSGVYGHGAAMLSGGVMMVTGGTLIQSVSKVKRATTDKFSFFNTTSMQWVDSYINPSSPKSPAYSASASAASTGLSKTERTGLGAGLGIGLIAVVAILVIWLLHRRRLREKRTIREKELRELALGAERYVTPSPDGDPDHDYPERRSASWHNMQERQMESSGPSSSHWPFQHDQPLRSNGVREAERTGALMEVPSPTRGLRRSLHSRGPLGMFQTVPGGAPGAVFRIDEEEENSQTGSIRRVKTPRAEARSSAHSDPFKDPPRTADLQDPAAQERKKEVQGWVDDWQSAAESILSRNPSQATHDRTFSNLSQRYANSHSSNSDPSGRGSPEKSDRTGSDLSEKSIYSQASLQRSATGTVNRTLSQRSASASYALFAGAAAAMGRLGGRGEQSDYGTTSNITRFPSNRSVSLNTSPTNRTARRERAETLSSAKTIVKPGEDEALLNRRSRNLTDDYWTPPESLVKDRGYTRSSSLTKAGAKAMGLMGSVKRVFSGTGTVNVQDRVANFENRSESSSPTMTQPEMTERPYEGEAFWKHKRGARDWDGQEGESSSAPQKSLTVRRKPLPGQIREVEHEDDDWDIETAVQKRVVQVMFTVPKEKLRVVNADQLSLLSSNRSDVDREEDLERERDVKRMSSVREGDEDMKDDEPDEKGKQPERD